MQKSRIVVERINRLPVTQQYVELVERKGLGHPDYIIDSACEYASVALSKYYLDNFGQILHHNLDKGLLVGGRSNVWFGGGVIEEPINILIAGRATTRLSTPSGEVEVPYRELIEDAVKKFIRENFRFLDPEKHVVVDMKIRMGSTDLRKIVNSSDEVPRANDTSYGVGYAPLSPLEKLVYETERRINSRSFKGRVPESGEDCKVMGLRLGKRYVITVADSIIASLTPDPDHYQAVKEEIREEVFKTAESVLKGVEYEDVEVYVNTADKPEEGIFYLTLTGTSAESGDDGNTGRGNRANGLITPNRQMSLEATAGKNVRSHVGKIYNIIARQMAERIYQEIGRVDEVYVRILSQIGRPITKPLIISIQYTALDNLDEKSFAYEAAEIAKDQIRRITELEKLVLEQKVMLF
ncbi:MAG: methionine adenosyltransferase [Thaumarchaeota archaeon]|nr:MAG: methionine adenosyltransferase [Nitrososphaerota archaeon]